MKFPKVLYVKSEKESSTEYFVADEEAAALVDMNDTIKLAKYQLVEVVEASGVAQFAKPKKR